MNGWRTYSVIISGEIICGEFYLHTLEIRYIINQTLWSATNIMKYIYATKSNVSGEVAKMFLNLLAQHILSTFLV
jgi:hypothetical protein